MSIGTAWAIPLMAAAGAALPILLLWCRPRSGRGWCRRCPAPDLWIVQRRTGRSSGWEALTWKVHVAITVWGVHLGRAGGATDPRDWIIVGLLFAAEILLAQRSRLARRRVIRCRMCESEAEPQDLRRSRIGRG